MSRKLLMSARLLPVLAMLAAASVPTCGFPADEADGAAHDRDGNAGHLQLTTSAPLVELRFENRSGNAATSLTGRDARLQLIVNAEFADGSTRDWTHQVTYAAAPPAIVHVDSEALVTPQGNGTATITAIDAQGHEARTIVEVAGFQEQQPISFPTQVVPLFTKLGCNGGGCHGKLSGQNGFRLSLLGFQPRDDFEHLVHESRGRRIFPAAPDRSLILQKAINTTPHGGGQRMESDSHEYRMLRRWIAQGMPYGTGNEPEILTIEVTPPRRQLQPSATQQLAVVARYTDGTSEDITRAAQFESNDPEMADVTPLGLVRLRDVVGDVAIMARYQGHVTVFRADIPLEKRSGNRKPAHWPEPRNIVDAAVLAKLRSLHILPSPRCDDATYLRRVTLDVAGRLPTLEETNSFAADTRPERRDASLERLLNSDDYADLFASKWNTILRNQRSGDDAQFGTWALHLWIRDSLRENKPYDQFVREILTASGTIASNPPVVWYRQVTDTNQRLEDAAQLFLGQRIQCARCHHHPYEKWSQRDYTQMAAFFSLISRKQGDSNSEPEFFSRVGAASAKHPTTGEVLTPAGLAGDALNMDQHDDPRSHLVDWMVDVDNPFFARALVNRYWKHFMGRGLVEPEDDLRVTNPPSNPELLDALAESFVQSGYDLKVLVRLICQSHTYGLSSQPLPDNLGDRRSYSRYYPKRLTAEVLLDAVDSVTGSVTDFAGMPAGTRAVALPDTGFDSYFLTVFGRPSSTTACECERLQEANLAQSLHLLNSQEIQHKLSDEHGRAAAFAADHTRTHAAKVRELYVRTFSRPPRDDELQSMLAHLHGQQNVREAYEDVVWSVINSKEFMFNH